MLGWDIMTRIGGRELKEFPFRLYPLKNTNSGAFTLAPPARAGESERTLRATRITGGGQVTSGQAIRLPEKKSKRIRF